MQFLIPKGEVQPSYLRKGKLAGLSETVINFATMLVNFLTMIFMIFLYVCIAKI